MDRPRFVVPHRTELQDGRNVIRSVLEWAGPRPTERERKPKYASEFADAMGACMAAGLRERLDQIDASSARTAGSVQGVKQLDVNYSTPEFGLGVGISLKSVHSRDKKSGRYTKNKKRNEEELRVESAGYHKRHPYAVMVGVLFLPLDSCTDGKVKASSFGEWVRHLRPYCSRRGPDGAIDELEGLYIGLYAPEELGFFDVRWDPPLNSVPKRMLQFPEFLDAVYRSYLERNRATFKWADGEEEPLRADERA